jgi:hypothetical protein
VQLHGLEGPSFDVRRSPSPWQSAHVVLAVAIDSERSHCMLSNILKGSPQIGRAPELKLIRLYLAKKYRQERSEKGARISFLFATFGVAKVLCI